MKRITLLLLVVIAASTVFAQKQAKPSPTKAIGLWRDKKYAEAKDMIDAATTFEKTMNDPMTWYNRGVIYATIDTIADPAVHGLAQDALSVSLESFKKADELDPKGAKFITQDAANRMWTKAQQIETLANFYLNKGINQYQGDEPNYDAAIESLDKTAKIFETSMTSYLNDTLTYYVMGIAAYNAEKHDKAIESIDKFFAKGGKSKDAYNVKYSIYNNKGDKEKALAVVREARATHPNNPEYPKVEIGLLIDLNRVSEAKDGLEKAVAKDPKDKVLRFYLGYVQSNLKNFEEARKNYLETLKLDPQYYEAQYYLAQTYIPEIEALNKQINALGISAADAAKKRQLVPQRVKKAEEAIPFFVKADQMKATDKDMQIDVLEKLKLLYYYTAEDDKSKVVSAKLKALGVED